MVRDTAKFLGAGVANLINIFNPEVVVICGGVTLAGARLFDPLRREVSRRAFKPAVEVCRIVPGELPGTAACRVRPGPFRSRWSRGSSVPKLGVLGSLVWDVIYGRDPAAPPVEEWGGIAYALGGFDASLPSDWEIVPLIKVGSDLRDAAAELFRSLTRRRAGGAVRRSPSAQQPSGTAVPIVRAALRADVGRCARMDLGELGPMVRDLDALYINFISGFEIELGTARALRQAFRGPIYGDLHSLFLGMPQDGIRVLQPARAPARMAPLLRHGPAERGRNAPARPDPMALAAAAIEAGVSLLAGDTGAARSGVRRGTGIGGDAGDYPAGHRRSVGVGRHHRARPRSGDRGARPDRMR